MKLFSKDPFIYPYTNIKTEGKALEIAPIPSYVKIPLLSAKQKIGQPLVKKGDKVLEGAVIGQKDHFLFYASISGIVESVENEEIRLNTTHIVNVPVISIRFSGKIVNWEKQKYDYLSSSTEELKNQILKMGVENLNPTSCLSIEDIINFPIGGNLIVTALEFSPMVNFNEELLLQRTTEIHTALSILEYIIKPTQTTIVVSQDLQNTYNHSQKNVLYLNSSHPNGFEARIFNYFTDSEEISIDLLKKKKYVIVDIQTLYHIYNAIVLRKPFIDQIITIDGKVAQYPSHYFVKIGHIIKELVEDIGIYTIPHKITSGNIFNADIIYNLEKYTHPHVYSLFLLDEKNHQYNHFEDCIQCNLCHTHCPVSLFPYDLARLENINQNINKCIDCGICSYVCPANIPLGYFLELKKEGLHE